MWASEGESCWNCLGTVHLAEHKLHCFQDGVLVQRHNSTNIRYKHFDTKTVKGWTPMHLPPSDKECQAHCTLIIIIYWTEIVSWRQWSPWGWQFLTSLEVAAAAIIILISYLELPCKRQLSLQLLYHKEEVAPHGRTELENKLENKTRERERVCHILERRWSHLPGLKDRKSVV